MSTPDDPRQFPVRCGAVALHGEVSGEGAPVLLLHGLTATRRYVVHGSSALQRGGCRVAAYDARGHGESDGAPPDAYSYGHLASDCVCVMDALGWESAVLVGSSMGAATALAVALGHPQRVQALVLVTPAHLGRPSHAQERWDTLSAGLRSGGVDGFLRAYGPPPVPERHVPLVQTVLRQRMARHRHPEAVADALSGVPRSAAFDGLDALGHIAAPVLVVASRDELDPEHPVAVAEEYVRRIPGARLAIEEDGQTPLAWRGGTLSAAILAFLKDALPGHL